MNEITVRKQASGSHLRDGARQTWLEKKNGIEMFNLTYAELSILRDQMIAYRDTCNRLRDQKDTNKLIKQVTAKMQEMVKVAV